MSSNSEPICGFVHDATIGLEILERALAAASDDERRRGFICPASIGARLVEHSVTDGLWFAQFCSDDVGFFLLADALDLAGWRLMAESSGWSDELLHTVCWFPPNTDGELRGIEMGTFISRRRCTEFIIEDEEFANRETIRLEEGEFRVIDDDEEGPDGGGPPYEGDFVQAGHFDEEAFKEALVARYRTFSILHHVRQTYNLADDVRLPNGFRFSNGGRG